MKLRKLASNVAYLTMDWVSITILSSLFWIISGKLLSSTELGIVATVFNFATILQFFSTLGIGIALSKLISEFSGNSNEYKIKNILSSAIKLLLISNLLLVLLVFSFAENLSSAIKLTQQTILISVVIAVFLSVSNVAGYIIIGFQNMRKLMLTNLFYHLVKVTISALLVFTGFSFFGPLLGITLGLLLLIILRLDSFRLVKFGLKSQNYYRGILQYSMPAFFGGMAYLTFSNAPYITLTVVQDLSITGLFTPAMLLATPLFIFSSIFASSLFPIISNLSGQIKGSDENAFLLNIVLRYIIFLTLPLAVFLILFSDQIILLLFKPEYLPAAGLLKILSIGTLLHGFSSIFLNTIYALKKPKIQQNILISGALFFILLSIPFTYYYSATGMTMAYIISAFILFILSYVYLRKLIRIKLPYSDIFKISLATILITGFIILTKPILPNLLSILLVLPSMAIFLISLFYINFYNSLDLRLVEFLYLRAPKYLKPPLKLSSEILRTKLKNTSRQER